MSNNHQDTLPGDIEIEQGLLGALLLNNNALDQIGDNLEPRHFAEPLHGAIYDIAAAMIREGRVVTPITIKPFLPDNVKLGGLTLAQYLARLAAEATSVINAADYARSIADLAARRALIGIGQEMIAAARTAPFDMPASAQIEAAERRLYEIAETGRAGSGAGSGFAPFAEAAASAMDMAAHACQRDSNLTGLATGIRDLDARMGGLQPSDLIIVAGRPGMGKTALATNIATHVASAGHATGFFSLEMSSEQLATRIIAERAGISSSAIRRGTVLEHEFGRFAEAEAELRAMPLAIDQTGALSIGKLCARARRLHRQHGLDLLVVDYIQLLGGNGRRFNDSRVQEVAEITTGLKGAGEGAERAGRGAVAALARGRGARGQAAAAFGPARVGLDRAGRRRGAVRVPRGVLPRRQGAAARERRASDVAGADGGRHRPRRADHRQAAARADGDGRGAV
jgi:replicative DNA helicase